MYKSGPKPKVGLPNYFLCLEIELKLQVLKSISMRHTEKERSPEAHSRYLNADLVVYHK